MPTVTPDGMEGPWGALAVEYRRHPETEHGPPQNTIRAYQADLTGLASAAQIPPSRVTLAHLRSRLANQVDFGAESATLQRRVSCTRGFFVWVHREGFIASDPATRLRAPRRPRNLPEAPTETQAGDATASLVPAVTDGDPITLRDVTLVELLYVNELHISEAYGLGLCDVDFGSLTMWMLDKGDKERTVPMGVPVRRALDAWLVVRDRMAVSGSPSRLFLGTRGGGLDPWIARRMVHAATTANDVSVGPHVLWHAMATHPPAERVDLRNVQKPLEYASVAATQRYTHVMNERLRAAFQQAHPRA